VLKKAEKINLEPVVGLGEFSIGSAVIFHLSNNKALVPKSSMGVAKCSSSHPSSQGGSPAMDHGWSQGSVVPRLPGLTRLIARGLFSRGVLVVSCLSRVSIPRFLSSGSVCM
jgi:hypothetical protein